MSDSKEYDIYRDSLLRYMGYSNEVGEAFRSLVPKMVVHASYGLAISYVCMDAFDKSSKQYKKPEILGGGARGAAVSAGDVFIWQMLASVIVPGFTINRICWAVGKSLKYSKVKHPIGKWLPTIVGLCSIPLIIKPIDHTIDNLMDNTYRKYVK